MGQAIAFIGVTLLSFITAAAGALAQYWYVSIPVFLVLWALAGVAFFRDVKAYGLDGDKHPVAHLAPKHAASKAPVRVAVRRTAGAHAAAA